MTFSRMAVSTVTFIGNTKQNNIQQSITQQIDIQPNVNNRVTFKMKFTVSKSFIKAQACSVK